VVSMRIARKLLYLPCGTQLVCAIVLRGCKRLGGRPGVFPEDCFSFSLSLQLLLIVLFVHDGLVECESVHKLPVQHLGRSGLQRPHSQDPVPCVRHRRDAHPAPVGLALLLKSRLLISAANINTGIASPLVWRQSPGLLKMPN